MMPHRADDRFIFMTGATGHTGSRMARRLVDEGWTIRCLVRTPAHARYLPEAPQVEIVPGDLEQPGDWMERLRGAHAWIHLANIRFAAQVVAAARHAQVQRVIAMSSTRRFTRFEDPVAQRVVLGEKAFEECPLDFTILRPTMIFGGPRDNNLEKIVHWLRRRRWMPLVAGGRNRVQPIFVGDLVEALIRTLDRPQSTHRRLLTVAGPEPMTQKTMIETIARLLDRPPIWLPLPYWLMQTAALMNETISPRPWLTRDKVRRQLEDKVFDIEKARLALGGWEPRPFEEAIRLKINGKA